LVLCGVLGESVGKALQGKLTEVLWEVEFETVVGFVLPKRGYAVASLKNHERDFVL